MVEKSADRMPEATSGIISDEARRWLALLSIRYSMVKP